MTREGFWVEKTNFSNTQKLRFWNGGGTVQGEGCGIVIEAAMLDGIALQWGIGAALKTIEQAFVTLWLRAPLFLPLKVLGWHRPADLQDLSEFQISSQPIYPSALHKPPWKSFTTCAGHTRPWRNTAEGPKTLYLSNKMEFHLSFSSALSVLSVRVFGGTF